MTFSRKVRCINISRIQLDIINDILNEIWYRYQISLFLFVVEIRSHFENRYRLVRSSIRTRTFKILFNDKWRLIGYRSRNVAKERKREKNRDVHTLSYRRGNPRLMGLLLEKENVIRAVCNAPFSEIQTKANRVRRIVPQRQADICQYLTELKMMLVGNL